MPAKSSLSLTLLLLPFAIPITALDPSCAPGGNFDLSHWTLQLPIGSKGHPTTIPSSSLQGCSGYQNPKYFFTESGDGALVMKVPGSPSSSGCVTTPKSKHCRTELREANPSSWDPNAATNRLSVTLAVTQPDDSSHGTVIGQIHIDDTISSKPVCELYYSSSGVISMGVEQTRSGGNELYTKIATVPVGTTFSYVISYEKNVLSVGINEAAAKILSTYSLNAPASYFKVGNYDQGNVASTVKFYAITVSH
jgi:hypothetical protein